jgi:hypothetical protein
MGYLITAIFSFTLGFTGCVLVVMCLVKLAESEALHRIDVT